MSEELDFSKLPLIVPVPELGTPLRFETYGELKDWAQVELNAWEPLKAVAAEQPDFGNKLFQEIYTTFSGLKNLAETAENNPEIQSRQKAASRMGGHLKLIASGQVSISASPLGQKVLTDILEGRRELALGRMLLAKHHIEVQSGGMKLSQLVRSIVDARASEFSGDGEIKAQTNALKKLRTDWDQSLEKLSALHTEKIQKADNDLVRAKKLMTALFNVGNRNKRDHQQRMTALEDSYRSEMELRAPASYWRWRAIRSYVYSVIAFLFLVAGAGVIVWFTKEHGGDLLKIVKTKDGDLGFGGVLVLTIPALAAFWVLRLVSRVFVGHLSAARDSALRSVMVQTYLALVADPKGQVGRDERLLILHALFRPEHGEGLEDAPPTNLLELMTKDIGGKR